MFSLYCGSPSHQSSGASCCGSTHVRVRPTPGSMNENSLAMTEGVKEFLSDLGLEKYYDIFITKGYDSETDIQNLQELDLDSLDISDPGHRQLLLTAAKHHTLSDEHKLYEWLRQEQLDYYFVNFVRSEFIDFNDLAKINLPDPDLYDELEIVLPGHRRRLERAVRQLRKRRRLDDRAEEPLVTGRWGKPPALVEAKYDFLCVEATIMSTTNAENCRKMEFMVDSGSDVVTLREEILNSLDLELLGPICSKGVHSSREKLLYRAKLFIGPQEIEIEVMPESYDSLGSRVLRHFRHFINGDRHVWLRGNYTEPSIALHRTTTSTPPHHISPSPGPHPTTSSVFSPQSPSTSVLQQIAPFTSTLPSRPSTSPHQSPPSTSPHQSLLSTSSHQSSPLTSPHQSPPSPSTMSLQVPSSTSSHDSSTAPRGELTSTAPHQTTISPLRHQTLPSTTSQQTLPPHESWLKASEASSSAIMEFSSTELSSESFASATSGQMTEPPSYSSFELSSIATCEVITSPSTAEDLNLIAAGPNVSALAEHHVPTMMVAEDSPISVSRSVEPSWLAIPESSSSISTPEQTIEHKGQKET